MMAEGRPRANYWQPLGLALLAGVLAFGGCLGATAALDMAEMFLPFHFVSSYGSVTIVGSSTLQLQYDFPPHPSDWLVLAGAGLVAAVVAGGVYALAQAQARKSRPA